MTGLQALIDEMALRNLVARYAHLADAGDTTGFAALFTEDGSWQRENVPPAAMGGSGLPAQRYCGPEALAGMIEESIIRRFDRRFRHQMSDLWIEVSGDSDTATGRCRALITDWTQGAGRIAMLGAYEFVFRRAAAGWKFAAVRVRVLPE